MAHVPIIGTERLHTYHSIHDYSHFIGHLLSRYRRISDCLYNIVYGQTGRYALYRPL